MDARSNVIEKAKKLVKCNSCLGAAVSKLKDDPPCICTYCKLKEALEELDRVPAKMLRPGPPEYYVENPGAVSSLVVTCQAALDENDAVRLNLAELGAENRNLRRMLRLSVGDRIVLATIEGFKNTRGGWTTQEVIAKQLGTCRESVCRELHKLVKAGVVALEMNRRLGSRITPTKKTHEAYEAIMRSEVSEALSK